MCVRTWRSMVFCNRTASGLWTGGVVGDRYQRQQLPEPERNGACCQCESDI